MNDRSSGRSELEVDTTRLARLLAAALADYARRELPESAPAPLERQWESMPRRRRTGRAQQLPLDLAA